MGSYVLHLMLGLVTKNSARSLFCAVLSLWLIGSAIHAGAQQKEPAKISVLVATGMPGSTYYQVGLGMASLWTTKLREMGIRVSAAISEGSLENIEAIRIADADLILVEDFFSSLAYKGAGMYRGRALPELRSITTLWPDMLHVLIRADKVRTGNLQDLEGLAIATELPDSGNKLLTEMLLKAVNSGKRKVRLRPMSNMAAADSLRKGLVHGIDVIGGIPIPLVANLFSDGKPPLALLDITDAQMESAHQEFGKHLFRRTIPTGTYTGQDKPVHTVGQMNVLAVTASLDEEVVYVLMKTLYENLDYMAKVHPACRSLILEKALDGLSIPLHEGAIRYYQERKIPVPENLIQ
ncbi:MAG TPA: TAXI family TRAP transporter solute-binding subunit [Desulfomonilaceae bacterium]|nr:TAXI family TRAP transporter solute-binding subunit [Desulfomonilaceae bacterium]